MNLSAIRGQVKALEALFVRLEGISDNSTNAAKIGKVLEEIVRKAHDFPASDLTIAPGRSRKAKFEESPAERNR
jgi:hypothetical protein